MKVRSLLKKLYRSVPLFREVVQIRDALFDMRHTVSQLRAAQLIRMFDFELQAHPRYSDLRRLHRYQFQVCSQGGEDGIIREIFHRIGITDRFFVEVGVGDGAENNTAFLLSQNWQGAWIDANDKFLANIKDRVEFTSGALRARVAGVSRENISALFSELKIPRTFDLLSIDIDQNTYYAWEGLKDYQPRVVIVEYNATIPADTDWKVCYDPNRSAQGTINFGASLKAFELLGRRRDYSLVGCDFLGVNAFFVRNDLIQDKFFEPFTSEAHYEPPRYALVYRRGHVTSMLDGSGGLT